MKKIINYLFKSLFILCAVCLMVGCKSDDNKDKDTFTITAASSDKLNVSIDIYETTFKAVKLSDYFTATSLDGLTYQVTSADESGVTTSNVQDDSKVMIFSHEKIGTYNLNVAVSKNESVVLTFTIVVSVIDGSPAPVLIKDIEDLKIDAPKFSDGTTNVDYVMDLGEYFDASDYVTYSMTCADDTVSMTTDVKKATFNFTSFGTKEITVNALKNGQISISSSFKVELAPKVDNNLVNGDFEQGWTGWNCDEWGKLAYSLYDSPFDIWGNNVNANGYYLYGYFNESGTAEFQSSLFKVGGTGLITFKMAGNSTEDLQLKLMCYNETGEDEEVAVFNNWYYGKYAGSGFIFRDYYYQIDLAKYNNKEMYFDVIDNRTEDFGFICLDDIVTYYEKNIDIDYYYEANFKTDPDGSMELDYTDTSKDAFPTDLSTVSNELLNGDFEQGYTGWYMSTQNKKDYGVFDSKFDIWSNPVNATKHYLYGYQNETAVCEFHSSLFKAGGTGLITFKMAGNSTADLQLKLMKYNPEGEDEEITKFNNWYFPISEESGFIFRQYYYQLDLTKYQDAYLYFVVKDARTKDFGFICLDDIVTYYETNPDTSNYFKAGYCTDPDAE